MSMIKKLAIAAIVATCTCSAAYAACTRIWNCDIIGTGPNGQPQVHCGFKFICR